MHIVDALTKKERAATDAAYRRGFQAGMREGYTSRVKDEVEARNRGVRVTQWSCGLCDNNTIELTLTGNRLDYDDADQIAATLIYHLNTIRAREFNYQKEDRND